MRRSCSGWRRRGRRLVSLVEALTAGGRGSSDRGGRLRQALVVAEIAIALLLLTGAGLLVRTLASLNVSMLGTVPRTSSRCRSAAISTARGGEAW